MIATVALFLVMGSTPESLNLHLVNIYKDVSTCNQVIDAVKREELVKPVEPLVGNALRCITISYSPSPVDEPASPQPSNNPSNSKESFPPCVSKRVLGKDVACGKDA